MGANSKDGANLTGLILARRRSPVDLLVKSSPNAAAPVVFSDWLFDAPTGGGAVDSTITTSQVQLSSGTGDRTLSSSGVSSVVQSGLGTLTIGVTVSFTSSSSGAESSSGTFLRTFTLTGSASEVQSGLSTLARALASSSATSQVAQVSATTSLLLVSVSSSGQVQSATALLGTNVVETISYNKMHSKLLRYIKPSLYVDLETGRVVRLVGQHLLGL